MPYASAAVLVALSGDPILVAATSAEKEGWRAAAIAAVEAYTRQSFEASEETLYLDGNGRDVLPLPRRAETITAVVHGSFAASEVELINHAKLRVAPYGATWLERAQEREWGHGRYWRRGEANVKVQGTFGWAAVPPEITRALAEQMADDARMGAEPLGASVEAYRAMGLSSISQGNLAMAFAGEGGSGAATGGLSPAVAAMIPRRFIWAPPAGGII